MGKVRKRLLEYSEFSKRHADYLHNTPAAETKKVYEHAVKLAKALQRPKQPQKVLKDASDLLDISGDCSTEELITKIKQVVSTNPEVPIDLRISGKYAAPNLLPLALYDACQPPHSQKDLNSFGGLAESIIDLEIREIAHKVSSEFFTSSLPLSEVSKQKVLSTLVGHDRSQQPSALYSMAEQIPVTINNYYNIGSININNGQANTYYAPVTNNHYPPYDNSTDLHHVVDSHQYPPQAAEHYPLTSAAYPQLDQHTLVDYFSNSVQQFTHDSESLFQPPNKPHEIFSTPYNPYKPNDHSEEITLTALLPSNDKFF